MSQVRRSAPRLGTVVGTLLLGGCWVSERYLVTPGQLEQARQVPAAEAAITALPVHRYVGTADHGQAGKAVLLRAAALAQAQVEPGSPSTSPASPTAPMIVRSRRYSPVVTAGAVLTGVGTVLSVAGTILYFAGSGDLHTAGGIVALSAEPMMLAGTLMWIFGILRPPQEVGAGRAGVHYLPALESIAPPPPPPPLALSLRF